MDERGIEPRAFPMRRERDTATPHTRKLTIWHLLQSIKEQEN